ncbi:hypothetical protein SAMN05421636_101221 [Pricia antarctica]|uniref:Uncharacterized protein n=1 Tax=Pricia antarctica TaxID=641691 RepID=A0A1G6W7T8_9FLAO|nr:hypothetical protein SAMN05421636_101221 [Pricia antarctica]
MGQYKVCLDNSRIGTLFAKASDQTIGLAGQDIRDGFNKNFMQLFLNFD